MFIKVLYFEKDRICGDSFKNKESYVTLNINLISSISEPVIFELPFSGNKVGNYFKITMSNGEIFYLFEKRSEYVIKNIKIINVE